MTDDFLASQGRFWLVGYLRGRGTDLLDDIEAGFKVRAKTLQEALGKQPGTPPKLMQVQEALSKTLGFANTHALQQLLNTMRSGLKGKDLPERWSWLEKHETLVDQLTQVYVLQTEFRGDVPMDLSEQEKLAKWADALSKHLGNDVDSVKDAVAMGWGGEATWAGLAHRSPQTKEVQGPLVTFEVEGDPESRSSKGMFHISRAGHWIWDNEIGSDPDEEPSTPEEARKELEKAVRIAAKNPELLVAWAAAAGIVERHGDEIGIGFEQAHKYLDRGIKIAEEMMPKGFKGTLDWYHHDNRPYLRSLVQKANFLLMCKGGEEKALRVVNKLRRVCPKNSHVDDLHCLVHVACKGPGKVANDSIEMAMRYGPTGHLNAGLAKILLGDSDGLSHIIEAVMRVPQFGIVLLKDERYRPIRNDFARRPVGYESPWDETLAAVCIMVARPGLNVWMKRILSDKALLSEEARLEVLVGNDDSGLNWEAWGREVKVSAPRMAGQLLRKHGIPQVMRM